jgi:DNA-binding transcriptional ArsR family regulator
VADTFAVLAEPTRRRILDELLRSDRSVGELVASVAISQPTMSKHLKVLREAGFVTCRTARQQRIYRIEATPFEAVDRWLEPYRSLWTRHLDALERHLDNQPDQTDNQPDQTENQTENRAGNQTGNPAQNQEST